MTERNSVCQFCAAEGRKKIMYVVAPSLFGADFTVLGKQVHAVEEAGAKYLHLDCFCPQDIRTHIRRAYDGYETGTVYHGIKGSRG